MSEIKVGDWVIIYNAVVGQIIQYDEYYKAFLGSMYVFFNVGCKLRNTSLLTDEDKIELL